MRRHHVGHTGPFVTWVTDVGAHRRHLLRTSRRQRKGLPALVVPHPRTHPSAVPDEPPKAWLRFWAPGRSQWWVAVLFMIGAALFAVGAAATQWPIGGYGGRAIGWTYFVGALFFTTAAYLQWTEALTNDVAEKPVHRRLHRWRFFGWRPRNLGVQAGQVQFVGTLLFNANTTDALFRGLGPGGENLLVWTPNMLGSVCFLVASQFAIMEDSHRVFAFRPRSVSWWITAVNMAGSILFMVSAVASYTSTTGDVIAPAVANLGTLGGGLCFFAGAYLLLPEMFEKPPAP